MIWWKNFSLLPFEGSRALGIEMRCFEDPCIQKWGLTSWWYYSAVPQELLPGWKASKMIWSRKMISVEVKLNICQKKREYCSHKYLTPKESENASSNVNIFLISGTPYSTRSGTQLNGLKLDLWLLSHNQEWLVGNSILNSSHFSRAC